MAADISPLGKKIRNFDPHGKTFEFNLDKYSCCKKNGKTCLAGNAQIVDGIGEKYLRVHRDDEMYCPNIINNIKRNGFDDDLYEIMVVRNGCGHYSVTNGQHRICAAAKAGISITVYLQEYDGDCYVCYWKKRSQIFKVKALLGLDRINLEQL